MAKRLFAYKPHVNEVLRTYPENDVNVYNLIDNRKEYIPEVFKYLLVLFSNLNINNSNKYIAKILIAIQDFYECFDMNNIELEKDLVEKLYSLRNNYEYFLEKNEIEANKNINILLDEIDKYLKEKYPQSEIKEKEDIFKLEKQMEEKDKEINDLNMKLNNLESQYDNIKKLNEKKGDNLSLFKKKCDELQEIISKLKAERKELSINLSKAIEERDSLRSQLEENSLNCDVLSSKIEKIESERDRIKNELSVHEKNAETEKNTMIRNTQMDNYIISKIIYDAYSIGDLCAMAYKEGLDYSITEIKQSLTKRKHLLKQQICFV